LEEVSGFEFLVSSMLEVHISHSKLGYWAVD
jgi:hypothetical protein